MRLPRTTTFFALLLGICLASATRAAPSAAPLPPPIDLALATQTPISFTRKPLEHAAPRPRQLLADFALSLRGIRYRRGGHDPRTGFDCSGFVRYVFRQMLREELPHSSVAQYQGGAKVTQDEMKPGDLVFFRIQGKRISHVGIYLEEGRFIHAPSSGKHIAISRLDEPYWAHRFAGARRPPGLA